MTLEDAAWVLVRNGHRGASGWLISNWATDVVELLANGMPVCSLSAFEVFAIAKEYERQAKARNRDLVIRVRYDTPKAFNAIYGPSAAMAVDTATLTPTAR